MGDSLLQNRLRDHEKAFDGLLSLIPAKMYYGNGEDTSEQWKKKKKTKVEKKAARIANLDPENDLNKSVKEVMDERARAKRKLEALEDEEKDDNASDDIEGIEKETPGQGLKKKAEKAAKKQKVAENGGEQTEVNLSAKEEKKLLAKQKKQERHAEKRKGKESQKTMEATPVGDAEPNGIKPKSVQEVIASVEKPVEKNKENDGDEVQDVDFSALATEEDMPEDSVPSSAPASPAEAPIFDSLPLSSALAVEPASTETSISSIAPSHKTKQLKIPADTTALRAKLAAKIEALRAARKADKDGKPIRTRQELIESRREKQAERKAHKKEIRRQAKLEEEQKREEALASARNSPLSPFNTFGGGDGSPNHFAFGRLAFADGSQMSQDLSYVKDAKKKKGPAANDAKAHLQKLEAQKERLAGMDEETRKDIEEKEAFLAARRRVEGEKIRDNESLLKKAIKRKEKTKKRSEREWKDRTKGVENAMKERQKKREDNIKKRKEEKIMGKLKKKGGKAKKGRPGFEGRW